MNTNRPKMISPFVFDDLKLALGDELHINIMHTRQLVILLKIGFICKHAQYIAKHIAIAVSVCAVYIPQLTGLQ